METVIAIGKYEDWDHAGMSEAYEVHWMPSPKGLDDLPREVRGTSRILRGGAVLWEKPFLTGEANMTHSLANLEHHHFKYTRFRRWGDVHVHFFGTATASVADGVETRPGDVFEISADAFALPLRNTLSREEDNGIVRVRAL